MREIEIKRDILYENELDEKHLNLIYILRFKLLFDINDRIAPLFFFCKLRTQLVSYLRIFL